MNKNYSIELDKLKLNFNKNKIIKNLWRFFKSPFKFTFALITKFFKLKKEVRSKSFYDVDFFLCMYDYDAFGIYVSGILNGYNEFKLTKFLVKNLNENQIFYDIGASYGFYTFLSAILNCETHSFEPNHYIFKFLKKTYEYNQNKFLNKIYLNNVGLGNKEEKKILYFNPDHSGGGSILKTKEDIDIEKSLNIEIFITTLDKYVFDLKNKPPSFIKIDAEGYEFFILKGGELVLKNYKPSVIMEVLPANYGLIDHTKNSLNFLKSLNYTPYCINENGELSEISFSEIIQKAEIGLGDNYLFMLNH